MTAIKDRRSSLPAAPPLLFTRVTGKGEPLVLLHGLASSSRYWEPNLPTLTAQYRVIAPDLLGFGRSPRPRDARYTPDEHLAALLATLAARLDGPVTLAGHSMGAVLALRLAVERPELVQRLLLISLPVVGPCMWGHHPDGGAHRLHHFSAHTPAGRTLFSAGQAALRPMWPLIYPRLRPDVPRGAAEDVMRASWAAYWGSLEQVVYPADVPALFAAVAQPLTVIHGARDSVAPVQPVRTLAMERSGTRYIEVVEAGHNPAFTHPHSLYAALEIAETTPPERDSRPAPAPHRALATLLRRARTASHENTRGGGRR